MYYEISESMARRAKEMNSFFDYVPGSATAEYRRMVDEAAALAERCKNGKDPEDQDKIDRLLDSYSRRLAAYINDSNRNDASCPSVLIAGPANFPVRKKERQNARADALMNEYNAIAALLDKMRSVGTGGIQSGDPHAIEKLTKKLQSLEVLQERMKAVNAYYRKNKTLDDCPLLTPEQIESIKCSMKRDWRSNPKPFESYELSNNNAEIRRLRQRIESLQAVKASAPVEQEHNGVIYKEDTEIMRVQLIFDGKPNADTRALLKSNGFRWAPSQGAWQRQLTRSGQLAAQTVLSQLK